jgi:phage terminase small subunit
MDSKEERRHSKKIGTNIPGFGRILKLPYKYFLEIILRSFPMKPRIQKVCNFYLSGLSMRESLLKAGFSDSYASHNSHKFLKSREVVKYIRQRQQDEANVALADGIFVKKKLLELSEDKDPKVRLEAIKQLDAHNEWFENLQARFRELEIKSELLKNNSEKSSNEPIRITIETIEKKPE